MNFLNPKLALAASLAGVTAFSSGAVDKTGANTNTPNIILIFTDDLGYGDLSCYGALQYLTSNLDKMAVEGVRFTNFMSAQAVCSASRAGIMTGCYPNRVGISGALSPHSKIGLDPSEETLAELLKKRNYRTAAIGKWHLGDSLKFLPLQQGFDEYLGIPYSNDMWPVDYDGSPFSAQKRNRRADYPPLPLIEGNEKVKIFHTLEDQADITTIYTERAVQFINRNKRSPFFIYMAHSMPHVPLAVSSKFKGKSGQGLYGDVIMEIDWSVGEIMKALKKNGLEKNTLVIFTSDNGPWLNFGNHAGSSGGFREGKGTSFEGGQRVPCIMKWPGQITGGTICNKLAANIDILPTLAAITKAPLPERKIDGVNILQLLLGNKKANPRESFLYYYRKNSLEAVREGDWKLIFAHPGRSYMGNKPGDDGFPGKVSEGFPYEEALFDLRRDPGERFDVKEYYPVIVAKLRKLADEAREDLGDDLLNAPGKNRRIPQPLP